MKLIYIFNITETPMRISVPYGIKKALFQSSEGVIILSEIGLNIGGDSNKIEVEFPIINNKSPNTFTVQYKGLDKLVNLRIFIEEIGGQPDKNYFKNANTLPEIDPGFSLTPIE